MAAPRTKPAPAPYSPPDRSRFHEPKWWFAHEGREYGPVSTEAMAQLCTEGVVRGETSVRSTIFRARQDAADVPALRAHISPTPAFSGMIEEALRELPSTRLVPRWYQFYPLDPVASGWAFGLLFGVALVAAGAKYMTTPFGAGTRARLGATGWTAACTFMLPLLVGWLLAAIAWQVWRRRRHAAVSAFWAGATPILLCAVVWPFVTAARAHRAGAAAERREAADVRAFVKDVRAHLDGKSPTTGPARQVAPTVTSSVTPSQANTAAGETDAQRVNRIVRASIVQAMDAQRRYNEAIAKCRIDELLQPRRLTDAKTYPLARQQCTAARDALATLEKDLERIEADVVRRLASSDLTPRRKEMFLATFAVERNESRRAMKELAAEERRIIFELESLLSFLEQRRTQMLVRDGRLMFRAQADAEEYNARAARLGAMVAEQAEHQAQRVARARKKLDDLATSADGR